MVRCLILFLLLVGCSSSKNLVIFSKTSGYRHESIPTGVEAVQKIGEELGYTVTHTEQSSDLVSLKYEVLVFLSPTGDVLNEMEQQHLQSFVEQGGGFVGIHSATDTEYEWEWYGKLVGAYFKNHPKIQKAKISTINKKHISTSHLNETWEIEEEWYNYKNINPEITVLLNLEESSYEGGENGKNHPITWYHEFDGGRSFYTGLGHKPETYNDERFIKLLTGGILYTIGTKN